MEVRGDQVAPVLLIGETQDAATGFSGNLEVRRRFPNARLIATRGGRTHANSLNGNTCVDDQIADYLADGRLPARVAGDKPDAWCDRLPLPEPEDLGVVACGERGSSQGASRRPWSIASVAERARRDRHALSASSQSSRAFWVSVKRGATAPMIDQPASVVASSKRTMPYRPRQPIAGTAP